MGVVNVRALARAVILISVALCARVWAQSGEPCSVLDPELQGVYKGGCVNGLAEGRGEARGKAQYRGEFRAGRKHGQGVKNWPSSGDRYEGDFVEDRKEGKGTYVWGPRSSFAGERYTGEWRNDKREGHGVYRWPNGERYAGEWKDDRIAGPPTKGMVDRARVQAERTAAVARIGTRVCREMPVGTAIREMIHATVMAADSERVTVRVENPGRYEHVIGDRKIAKGDVITDLLRSWVPCA